MTFPTRWKINTISQGGWSYMIILDPFDSDIEFKICAILDRAYNQFMCE